jgi:hypothetical protein
MIVHLKYKIWEFIVNLNYIYLLSFIYLKLIQTVDFNICERLL